MNSGRGDVNSKTNTGQTTLALHSPSHAALNMQFYSLSGPPQQQLMRLQIIPVIRDVVRFGSILQDS